MTQNSDAYPGYSGAGASEDVYNALLGEVKRISETTGKDELVTALNNLMGKIIDVLSSTAIMELISKSGSVDKEDYFFAHSLNVCMLAIRVGIRRGFPKRRLKDLALLALDHAEEYIGIPEGLLNWIERDDEIDDIVKLADMYDTLTHPPSYRHTLTPSDTLISIMDSKNVTNQELVKVLLSEVGLYPVGCLVQMNTGEVGEVIKANRDAPMRPVIRVLGEEEKEVDLADELLVRITRGLTEDELKDLKK